MSPRAARLLTFVVLALLLVGTLVPGPWVDGVLRPTHHAASLRGAAHVILFAFLAMLLPLARWWEVRGAHVLLLGLALALITEGLQFFAIARHPNLAGVTQDVSGALLGWIALNAWRSSARRVKVADHR